MSIELAIQKAVHFLAANQLPGGGFESLSLEAKNAKQGGQSYQTTFFPSLILQALQVVSSDEAEVVKKALSGFLIEQKSTDWSFNYWDRSSEAYKHKPYPDDLDDTFCALAALYGVRPDLFTPSVLACSAKLLMTSEVREGGPYKTWLTTSRKKVWNDVDVAVNANIGHFLSIQDVELPSITEMVESCIRDDKLASPYYVNDYPLIYFVTRWYRGECSQTLVKKLLARREGAAWRHPQRTAMAVTSLLALGYDHQRLHSAIDYLLNLQQADGSWEAEAFCVDPAVNEKPRYGSSKALTTALCIEALARYEMVNSNELPTPVEEAGDATFYSAVITSVDARIDAIEHAELHDSLLSIFKKTCAQDTDLQIVLLPLFVARAFELEPSSRVLHRLAEASMWGWMAYTTYDDFLDNEGEPSLLPAANVCLRYLVEQLIATLPSSVAFQLEVKYILERLDAANTWELMHCRGKLTSNVLHIKQIPDYGNYWQLADRSLGHTISGLGALYASGIESQAPAMALLRDFMYHYLVARQLNDDAHDWYTDLTNGHVNAVSAMLLSIMYPVVPRGGLKIDIVSKKSVLQQRVWEEVIDQACADIKKHVDLARATLQHPDVAMHCEAFEKLLEPIEKASAMALQKRNEALEFIAAL